MAKKKQLNVQDTIIRWQTIEQKDYINLTDIARKFNDRTDIVLQNWLRNPNTIEFLITWEEFHNPKFNPMQLHGIDLLSRWKGSEVVVATKAFSTYTHEISPI